MVISCKRSCVSAGYHPHAPSGRDIWEELKSNCDTHAHSGMLAAVCSFCRVLHSTLLLLLHNSDSQSVNRLPKSIRIYHSLRTLQTSLLLLSPNTVQIATFFTNSKKEHRLQQLKKIYNRFNHSLRLTPQCIAFSSIVSMK